jgi:hypothetical protein
MHQRFRAIFGQIYSLMPCGGKADPAVDGGCISEPRCQVPPDDKRIRAETQTVPSPQGNGSNQRRMKRGLAVVQVTLRQDADHVVGSATTLLVSSALRWMNGAASSVPVDKRKLLGFTDNRQDAALQAGQLAAAL